MNETRLSGKNAAIAEMFEDGEKLKNFYRFIAQNPHINLHDACQIIIERPNATVCYSFSEWAAMDRRVTKGRKGIAFNDLDGYRQFVFDANDTHGNNRYVRPTLPMKHLLGGLDELNGTALAEQKVNDYQKIYSGVHTHLQEQGELTGDLERNDLLISGVAYSLYSKTGFPKSTAANLDGLPYTFKENADFIKEVYVQTVTLAQEVDEAYENRQTEVPVIADTEEETVSDEPVAPVEHTEEVVAEKPKHPMYPIYEQYMQAQSKEPKAIVLMRVGDFYEIMGDNAATVAKELDLTLTGRNVGLSERVPMCGMPYHAMDNYLDKILEKHSVLLVDGEEEPIYILSHAEAKKPVLEEIDDNEPTPFDDEQTETDEDWRKELAAELGELADEDGEAEELDEIEETDEGEDDGEEEVDEQSEEPETPKENIKPTQKKAEKGIMDRKRKDKPQPTLFDITEPQEQSAEEALIERQLKYGSGVEHGKFRIFDKYNENPSANTFIAFLKNEYGWGGHGGWGGDDEMHDAKGIEMSVRGEKGECLVQVKLKWPEVANRIADLIDDDNYLTEQEKKQYVEYKIEQNRLREQRLEEERQKNELIDKVIFSAPPERKQRILDEYAVTTKLTEFAEFLKNEYGTSEEFGEGFSATYNVMGVWIFKGENHHGIDNRTYLKWEEFADKVCALIENDRYIEQPFETLTPEQKITAIVDNIVKEGAEKTTGGKWFIYFEDFKEDEPFVREHHHEIAQRLVSRKEVARVGVDDISIDATFNLEYCPNYDWNADDKQNEQPKTQEEHKFNRFKELTAEGKVFFDSYQKQYIREPTDSPWDEVQSCRTVANGIYEVSTEGHGGVMIAAELAPYILSPEALKVGFQDYGYYCFEEDCNASVPFRELYDKGILAQTNDYFTHFYAHSERPEAKDGRVMFNDATEEEKAAYFERWNKAVDKSLEQWNGEYWQAHEQEEQTHEEETQADNTDLNGVLDQDELGGAKTRFRNNVAAIKLVNKLYAENRNATDAEKKVLAQFVGWGGLAQAFDEANPQWNKEFTELKGLLSQEDYEQARSSTLNAYYTAKDVIGGIYSALNRFGVKGNNRILEPSMGTGNFFGFMPQEIADGSRLYGVELDNLTGRIAAKLYPQANVQIKGFEVTTFPNDKFDIVVGNVPFGGYGVADSDYNRYNFKVHDYFLAKSIDKVKPNGIVAIVTSKGTMDKLNPSARKYVAERAELLGAIRLPNTAFKRTAGTEAVADILFFRKRIERLNTDTENIEWLGVGKTKEGFEINQYYIDHPEMVLGTLAEETGLYGGVDVTVKPDGRELSDALAEAVKNLPQGFYLNPEVSPEAEKTTEVDYNVKPMCYKAENGRLYMRVGEQMEEQPIPKVPKDAYQRIQSMIALREELHHVLDIQIQGCSDEQLMREQSGLNVMYDRFVRRFGNINSQTNMRLFKDDGDSALLFACEDVDKETKAISKSEVFSKRTIRPYVVPTATDDCFEALQISKNERGRVDIAYIEELTGKSYDDVLFELGDAVFRNPQTLDRTDKYSGFETSEEYLSGNVVDKLEIAKRYAEQYPEYRGNADALEKVQPTPLTASEIAVRLGASWVDKDFYKQFYCQLVGVSWWGEGDVQLYYNPHDSSWRLDQKDTVRYRTQMKQKEVYGTTRAPAYRIFMDCMNLRPTTIYDLVEDNGKEKRVVNHAETIAAREKQNKIREEFDKWIFAKPERREELEATYNRLFNHTRLPSYDGSYLKFPEMNPAIELREHQKNAVHRIITSGDGTLLHHVVGSGKTYTMAASIMKMRQLGLCKKAMVAVPNHLVQQWASEWRKLYPNAKLLIATKEDLDKDNRMRFVSKVAMGDWDGIIIAQSSFAKIPVSHERQVRKLNEEIEAVELTIQKAWEEQGMPRGAVKNLETIKKNKQAQLKKLMDGNGKDSVLNFESLGVDYLFVDEAHYYKNLFLYTKMSNVAGISNAASQRASDLKLKCEYLQEMHGNNRGVVFATGTPISNSMTEMYTMQTYLQPRVLKESGLAFFDNWAADFGETITSMELMPSGQGYRARTRFAKFTNLPELLTMYRSFADVQTSDTVKLDVPEAERHVINLKPSDTVIELAESIAERADRIYGGGVDPHIDNMLKVTSDGKKLALDPRCFKPDSKDEPISKLNEAAQRIYEIWENTADIRGTQIVFCDLSTPKVKHESYVQGVDFDAYNELKHKLVQKGIPADEVAFIHDANTDESKQALFDKVNSGAVRVLIGSTEKCGAGTNVQKRLVALHHLDTPYRPSDMEQREGRIIRQGNTNEKVDIFTYVTERTFDSYSYQILENKQRFISQINKGDLTVREAEDIDETTLSYAEIKAITAANPMIKRKMEVDTEIARLRVLEGQYKKNLYSLQDKIRKSFPEEIRKQELLIERATLDLMHLQSSKPSNPEAFEISVNGTIYTDKKEGGRALTDALYASVPNTVVAEYCGFKISICPMNMLGNEREITLAANGQYTISIGESASGNLQRIENFFENFPKRKERLESRLQQLKDDLKIAEEQVKKPFEHREQLSKLLSEQAELNAALNLDKKDDVIVGDNKGGSGEENYMSLPTPNEIRRTKIIDDEETKTVNPQSEEKPMTDVDYKNEVIKSVENEFNEYKQKVLALPPEKIFYENYKIHVYTELKDVIDIGFDSEVDTGYLSEEHYRALYEERGNILNGLYDDFIGDEFASVNTGTDTAEFIKQYCTEYHSKIFNNKPVYLETAEYAREHDELENYHDSRNITLRCKSDIAEAFRNNYDGMRLNEGFEEKLIDEYGIDRVAYVLANTIREHETDGRFSRENKAWAYTIPVSQDIDEHRFANLDVHPAVLDVFVNRIHNKLKENQEEKEKMAEQDKYKHFTARGDKVLSIVKDRDDRNIAIIQREGKGDFVVAARYDTSDGTWGQGRYDFKTLEDAEKYRQEKYGFENTSDTTQKKWLTCKISPEALIKRYQFNSRFRMPQGSGYEGYAYSIYNDRIKDSTYITDLQSDTRERALLLHIPDDTNVEISKNGETVEIEPHEFVSLVHGTMSDKYEREQRYIAVFPPEAIIKDYETSMLMAMPNDSKYKGYVYYMPSSVVRENRDRDDGSLIANISESFKVTLRKGEEKVEITAKEYSEMVGGRKADKYKREPSEMDNYREQQGEDDKAWTKVTISENAVIANYENSTLFKMPKGEYAGYVYYIPGGMVRKDDEGLYLRIPEDFEVHLKDTDGKNIDITAEQFVEAIDGKTDESYENIYRRPSEVAKKQFAKVEAQLRRNIPEEMKSKSNWVVVRTRANNDTGRLDKFLINVHTGNFAESDNPETWTDFDTACEYARENGGVALAYALDGKDGIACIDLDGCMEENGDFSDIANKAFMAANGSYAEKSISGKGLHIFGKTKGADLRSFSKDKTMEYYQGGHFIAMTGDFYGSSELKSFDTPEMQGVLESKLEKRTEWKHTGEGIEGLSSMDDREMLEKAFAAKNGDTVKRLYNGEDIRGNHSNSDMSLMNYLAFWSSHDIDQMLRVFSTSGLYRADKPQSYYEHTAIKAVKGTPYYTPPKASNNKPASNGNNSGKDGK